MDWCGAIVKSTDKMVQKVDHVVKIEQDKKDIEVLVDRATLYRVVTVTADLIYFQCNPYKLSELFDLFVD
jgi:hypothetical protein